MTWRRRRWWAAAGSRRTPGRFSKGITSSPLSMRSIPPQILVPLENCQLQCWRCPHLHQQNNPHVHQEHHQQVRRHGSNVYQSISTCDYVCRLRISCDTRWQRQDQPADPRCLVSKLFLTNISINTKLNLSGLWAPSPRRAPRCTDSGQRGPVGNQTMSTLWRP